MASPPKTTLTVRSVGDVAVFDIAGEFSRLTSPLPTLYDLVKASLDSGQRRILLNLEKSSFIDSFGVQEIISSFTSTQKLGGAFKLCRLTPRLDLLFEITGLKKIFSIYPDEAAALAAFAKPPSPDSRT